MIILGDSNAHVGHDAGVEKVAICRHGDTNLNYNGKFLQLYCNALCIVDTFLPTQAFAQEHLMLEIRWVGDPLISASFQLTYSKQCWTYVSPRVQNLSTDHCLFVCKVPCQRVLHKRAETEVPTKHNGSLWWTWM